MSLQGCLLPEASTTALTLIGFSVTETLKLRYLLLLLLKLPTLRSTLSNVETQDDILIHPSKPNRGHLKHG